MRFFHPDTDLDALAALVALCHPTRRSRGPLWWQIMPTIVVDRDGGEGLVGYAQYSFGESTLFLQDLGVHPDTRRAGLGRRLLAEQVMLGQRLGAARAIGYAPVANTPMRTLLAQSKFTPTDLIQGYYQDTVPVQDGMRYMSTPASFEWAAAEIAVPVEVQV